MLALAMLAGPMMQMLRIRLATALPVRKSLMHNSNAMKGW